MALLLKNLLFTLVVPGTVAGFGPHWIASGAAMRPGPFVAVASLLFALGAAIYAWCVWDFATFGRGTPAPIDAPKQLVVRGLYRFSRNPMYVGVLTVISGWVALYATPALVVYAVAVFCAFQSFIVLYEEPHLEREFGDTYVAYKRRVGRWLARFPTGTETR